MTSFSTKNLSRLKFNNDMYNKKKIQIFGTNMPFISSSEAKNAYFTSGKAKNEICIFSLQEMKHIIYVINR